MTHTHSLRRFASAEIDPSRAAPLSAGHPALSEGRTIYMATVTPSKESPRFLVSGHNNPKLGKVVMKGERKGWPIYHLALEERATCPRSCLQWASCYGNSMPYSRRHTPDDDFERYLIAEVTTICRQHPEGLLVRLHSLGDFYSVEYVYIWASLLKQFPQLHVFGYTARCIDDPDPETRRIARAIQVLTDGAWNRFAIRTSGGVEERSVTMVADSDEEAAEYAANGVIMCPAQTKATEACATCGLCWAESARDKAIGFLIHGRKLATGPRGKAPQPKAPVALADLATKLSAIGRVTVDGVTEHAPGFPLEIPKPKWPMMPTGPRSLQLLDFLKAESSRQGTAMGGRVQISLADMARGSGIPSGTLGAAIYDLEKRGAISVEGGRGKRKSVYTLAPDLRVPQGQELAPPKPVQRAKPVGRPKKIIEEQPPEDRDGYDRFKARVVDVPAEGVRNVTRALMGDPPPGRTPWATA